MGINIEKEKRILERRNRGRAREEKRAKKQGGSGGFLGGKYLERRNRKRAEGVQG